MPAQPPSHSVRCHSTLRAISQDTSALGSKNPSEKSSADPFAGVCSASQARASSRKAASSGESSMSTH